MSTLNTQGLQSSCGAHPSQQENYTGRLPGCPDFTLPGLGFWGCDPTAPGQLGSSPPAELQHVPGTTTQVALPVPDSEERSDLGCCQLWGGFCPCAVAPSNAQPQWVLLLLLPVPTSPAWAQQPQGQRGCCGLWMCTAAAWGGHQQKLAVVWASLASGRGGELPPGPLCTSSTGQRLNMG